MAMHDQIDFLATRYNFSPEELDSIINNDIKYCMSKELVEGEDQ